MAQTFGSLPTGAKFDFDPGKWGLSYHGGPYIKTSSRKYKEINSDKVHTIGSIKAKVIQQNPMTQFPKGKFVKVDAIRVNRNGTISVKVPDSVVRRNPTLRRNIAGGAYGAGGVFHPFRSSPDYDPDRAGDEYGARTDNAGFTRRKKAAAKTKRRKPVAKAKKKAKAKKRR